MKIANGMEFINDEVVIGKWQNIGWTNDTTTFSIDNLNDKSGDFEELYFLPDGEAYWMFEGWTKGILLIHYGGSSPILTYKYDTKTIDEKNYLFLRLDDKTEVFEKINSERYKKATLGRHDDVNLPFINDEDVIGKWEAVDCVSKIEDFSSKQNCDNLCFKSVEFLPEGKLIQSYMDEKWDHKWTKGYIINLLRTTVGKYQIKVINNTEYLFIEWKMGNYIYGGKDPDYYVFKRK